MSEPRVSRRGGLRRAVVAVLTWRHGVWLAVGLAVVFTLPSLWAGLVTDDYHHKLLMQGPLKGPERVLRLMERPWDMFRFFGGAPGQVRALIDYGAIPWWSYEHVRGAFWRPITSLTHWADYLLWPHHPALMHAQSIAWYALAVGLVALLYRRLMGVGAAATLAAVLFAVDYTHGLPVGFLANRSDLPAVVFGVLCLLAHDRWRRSGAAGASEDDSPQRRGDAEAIAVERGSRRLRVSAVQFKWLALALLALSLLSKEAGIATCAYLAAYEAFLVDGPWWPRLRALAGYALVVVVWRACWTWLGYGVAEIGLYIDPLTQTGRYLAALPERLSILMLGLWGLPPADVALFMGARGHLLMAAWGLVFVLLLAVWLGPLIRRDRLARFWTAGMLLSLLPACATFVSGRLLMFAGLGAWGLLAQWLTRSRFDPTLKTCAGDERACAAQSPSASSGQPARARWFARVMAGFLLIVHLGLSPVLLMATVRWPAGSDRLRARVMLAEPLDAGIRFQDLVLVNPPAVFALIEGWLRSAADGAPMPRHVRALVSADFQPVEVYRPDERTLVLRPEAGFLNGMLDELFRGAWRPFAVGDEVRLTGMTARILELSPSGRPVEVAFQFDVPLEDPGLRWMCWREGRFEPFQPPHIGARVVIGTRMNFRQIMGS